MSDTHIRRGYSQADAEAAYEEWRRKLTTTGNVNEPLIKSFWLAGWHFRGEVAYDQPDDGETPKRQRG